jgi:DNA modification methylase
VLPTFRAEGAGGEVSYYTDPLVTLHVGDCLDVLPTLEADSVDAVVTDPPYGLEFMGKEWDAFRSDDPGTNRHRGARADGTRITKVVSDKPRAKDNPWEKEASGYRGGDRPATNRCVGCGKRDQFRNPHACPEGTPWKSELIDPYAAPPSSLAFQNWCRTWALALLRVTKPGGYLLAFGGTRTHHRLVCALEDAGWIIRDELDWIYASGFPKGKANLKPAHEPIVLARKPGPLRPLGIDECRIGTDGGLTRHTSSNGEHRDRWEGNTATGEVTVNGGRWPSNVLLSSPELFDQPNPYVVGSGATTTSGDKAFSRKGSERHWEGGAFGDDPTPYLGDSGGYARFFKVPSSTLHSCQFCGADIMEGEEHRPWCPVIEKPEPDDEQLEPYPRALIIPKADRAERERGLAGAPKDVVQSTGWSGDSMPERRDTRPGRTNQTRPAPMRANVHPTVKPIDLMRHLVRLVTPPNGVVLDPFLGSGTTCLAASEEGFRSIGIERELEYLEIAKGRLMATPMGLGLDHGLTGKAPPKTHPDLSKHQPKRRAAGENYSGGWAGTDEEPAA